MTEMDIPLSGASTACPSDWRDINWRRAESHVRKLQLRIAKAYREKRHGKARALQWLLTHSLYAKMIAVKRITQNKGGKTAGVDKIIWSTPEAKMKATLSLRQRGYRTQPLKRIYIPKKQKGKLRPLSIPVMKCRAMQALYLLALEPIAETIADKNAYGFRPYRSTNDALEQCYLALAKRNSAQWILEGDIKSCFDEISHSWLLENTPIDKNILSKWLKAGYIEKSKRYNTTRGTPQGGIISPTLLNVTLAGLEDAVKAATSKRNDKVNIVVYADDFIITGATKEVLTETVQPVVEAFLEQRGLTLSKEKTKVSHISEGFDFLGVTVRKFNGKFIKKPAKTNVKKFLEEIRLTVKKNPTAKTENLIYLLNPKIQGWANYHRYQCSKRTFTYVSYCIFNILWRWARRRHPDKSAQWVRDKYYRTKQFRRWTFTAWVKDKNQKGAYRDLVEISTISIKRHVKIKAKATPFDPAWEDYFLQRRMRRKQNKLFRPCRESWSPWWVYSSLQSDDLE